ncbi:hypothetical protein AMECASPLE_005546 [Ameca splendens]|uniref:Uncharacterized protein n=1 Tax=Ameca splendens TaxID=208324 RepID=A0ABV0YAX1_9TELE
MTGKNNAGSSECKACKMTHSTCMLLSDKHNNGRLCLKLLLQTFLLPTQQSVMVSFSVCFDILLPLFNENKIYPPKNKLLHALTSCDITQGIRQLNFSCPLVFFLFVPLYLSVFNQLPPSKHSY